MADSDQRALLSSVHARLVEALADLDHTGRHAAAAHLVAVIELVEDDIGIAPAKTRDPRSDSVVAVLASQMSERFGDRAKGVARRQLADATGSSLLAWAAIINRIPQ